MRSKSDGTQSALLRPLCRGQIAIVQFNEGLDASRRYRALDGQSLIEDERKRHGPLAPNCHMTTYGNDATSLIQCRETDMKLGNLPARAQRRTSNTNSYPIEPVIGRGLSHEYSMTMM